MVSRPCYYDIFTREWGASLSEINMFAPENRPFAPKGHVIFQPSMFHVQVLLQLVSRRANEYKKNKKKVVPENSRPWNSIGFLIILETPSYVCVYISKYIYHGILGEQIGSRMSQGFFLHFSAKWGAIHVFPESSKSPSRYSHVRNWVDSCWRRSFLVWAIPTWIQCGVFEGFKPKVFFFKDQLALDGCARLLDHTDMKTVTWHGGERNIGRRRDTWSIIPVSKWLVNN